jgi:signal transduction histidine kinase
LVTEMQPLSDSGQPRIEFKCLEETLMCSLDARLVRAMLTKLLTNAINYSSGGSAVHFNLTHSAQTAIIKIEDSGIGMLESDQERLFEPFFRGSNVSDVPGTGLGLATVKNLVELNGGEMDWVSQVGVGTVATIRLNVSRS